jgi:hypothetical protein
LSPGIAEVPGNAGRRCPGYTEPKPPPWIVSAVSYAIVEDVAASWESYEPYAAALEGPAPEGLILHAAGRTDEGFRIIELWESEQAWRAFVERVGRSEGRHEPYQALRALRPEHVVYGGREKQT